MSPDSPLPPRAWLIVVLLWFTVFANYLARVIPTTMHNSLIAAIPMTEGQYGLLTSALLWTYGVMSPFCGFLADRLGRSRVIIVSMFLWSLITWITSFARTFNELLVLRALMGISEACYMPAALALIADYHRGATRSMATGIHHSGYVLGIGLSGVGGWLAEHFSWHFTFSVVGLAGLVYSIPLGLLLRDVPREGAVAGVVAPPVRLGHAIVSLFASRGYIIIFTAMALLNLSGWPIIAWMPVFLQEQFHLSQAVASLATTASMNSAAACGLILCGILADRWSRRSRRGRMYVTSIGLLIAAPGLLLTTHTEVFALAIVGLVVLKLAGSSFDSNTMPVLCEVVDPRYRATSYGLLNMVGSILGGIGIYLAGVGRDHGINLHVIFNVAVVFCVTVAGLYFFIRPQPLASAGGQAV